MRSEGKPQEIEGQVQGQEVYIFVVSKHYFRVTHFYNNWWYYSYRKKLDTRQVIKKTNLIYQLPCPEKRSREF